jgi:hypothetical protein
MAIKPCNTKSSSTGLDFLVIQGFLGGFLVIPRPPHKTRGILQRNVSSCFYIKIQIQRSMLGRLLWSKHLF